MSTLTTTELSSYRQKIGQLVKKIDRLSSRCLFLDPLIRGTPGETFRTCGKKNCKCMKDSKNRHGPYKVISITRDKKQRHIPLRKDNQGLWQLAVHYQHQIDRQSELKKCFKELLKLCCEIIEKRIQEFP